MSTAVGYRWHLRLRMAERGMFATTELGPLLAERGVVLSREQVYRLAAGTPERLSLHTLAALCDILDCTASDLIEPVVESKSSAKHASGAKASVAHAVPRELRPNAPASSPTRRNQGERRRLPALRPVRAGAAHLPARRPEWARHLLKLLATTDCGMHGLRRRTSLQRSRGRAADM